jgi:outer membrane lipoprotein-sorting protein
MPRTPAPTPPRFRRPARRLAWGLALSLAAALCLAAASPAASPPAQPAPPELAKRVQERYRAVESLSASYTRLSRFAAAGHPSAREVRASGRLYWARPLSLRIEQASPRQEQIITAEQGVWWVRPERLRADLYPVEQFTSGLRSLLDALNGLAEVDKSFDLGAPTAADRALAPAGWVLVLAPRERRVDLKRLVVWFDPADLVLRGFRLETLVGDVTEYRLSEVKVNPPLPEGLFGYDPPPDFRVRDHRRPPEPRGE